MTIILHNRQDINLENARLSKMERARADFERLLASDVAQFIYGTTTAPGARAKDNLSPDRQQGQGRTLRDFISLPPVGVGDCYLPEHISLPVRAA